jgi:hypothetical protein
MAAVACEACAHVPPPAARYLYEVSCAAEVQRFDTLSRKKTAQIDLARHAGGGGGVPVVEGALEVCLTRQALYDASVSIFYTLVPTSVSASAGTRSSYRVLGFSVPGLTLVERREPGALLEEPPHLEWSTAKPRTIRVSAAPVQTELDVSTLGGANRKQPNRILEMSASRVLIELLGESELSVAVVDTAAKTLVRLKGLPLTASDAVHLSPGGTHVLVEEVASSGTEPTRTGKLLVYSADTGLAVETLSDPALVGLYFRGITPNGLALYDKLDGYRFVDLRMTFPAEPVSLPPISEFPAPAVFFADR